MVETCWKFLWKKFRVLLFVDKNVLKDFFLVAKQSNLNLLDEIIRLLVNLDNSLVSQ